MPASSEARRARPLLGTFVEITGAHRSAARRDAGIDAAFAAVERVQELMSFHDPASELSRLNRRAAKRAVTVDPWTFEVLETAARLHTATGGAFDITIAPWLVELGYLPGTPARRAEGTAADIELRAGRRVRFRRPLQIDLGGIAKGFAVDQAVAALRAHGITRGCVNAGGDLRVFGRRAQVVHVRHPAAPGELLPLAALRNEAMATSAVYFSRKKHHRRWVSPFIDPKTGRACAGEVSVSVRAATCLLADALTKVLVIQGAAARSVLKEFAASALLLDRQGAVYTDPSWP